MSTDLRSQLVEYGVHHRDQQTPVSLDEIMALGDKVRPIPVAHPSPRRWRKGLATAVATGVIVLLAFGLVSLLLVGGEPETPPAGPVSTTVAPTTVPSTQPEPEVDDTLPTGSTVPNVEESPEIDPISIGLPLIAEVVTASSIGDVVWRIFESDGEEQSFEVMRGLGAVQPTDSATDTDQGSDATIAPEDVFVVDGQIAVEIHTESLAVVSGSDLRTWWGWFDPFGTALIAEPELEARRLGLGERGGDSIEVALYETELDASLSKDKPNELTAKPVEIVAKYRVESSLQEDGTVLVVIDEDTGQVLGTVRAAMPVEWSLFDEAVEESFYTVSNDGGIKQVVPEWDGGDFDASVSTGEQILVYIEASGAGGYEIWQTSDLQDWTNLGPPTGWPAGYAQPQVSYQDGMFQVDLNDQIGGRPNNIFMNSPNGIDWVPVENLPSGNGRLIKVESGFVWMGGEEVEVWTSPDATDWEMIDLSDMPVPLGGLLGSGELGNVAWFHQAEEVDRLWVLQFTGG